MSYIAQKISHGCYYFSIVSHLFLEVFPLKASFLWAKILILAAPEPVANHLQVPAQRNPAQRNPAQRNPSSKAVVSF